MDAREDLKSRGWVFIGIERCKGKNCGAQMEIWKLGGRHPTRVYDHVGTFQSHFVTCPDRADFKRNRDRLSKPKLNLKQGKLF